MKSQELIETARTIIAGDKGLLAMDESNPNCNKRFARLGIPQTEEARRTWRVIPERKSSKVWTDCATASRNTFKWARGDFSG
jgi:fructose-bisphosphate aldolase class 1